MKQPWWVQVRTKQLSFVLFECFQFKSCLAFTQSVKFSLWSHHLHSVHTKRTSNRVGKRERWVNSHLKFWCQLFTLSVPTMQSLLPGSLKPTPQSYPVNNIISCNCKQGYNNPFFPLLNIVLHLLTIFSAPRPKPTAGISLQGEIVFGCPISLCCFETAHYLFPTTNYLFPSKHENSAPRHNLELPLPQILCQMQ